MKFLSSLFFRFTLTYLFVRNYLYTLSGCGNMGSKKRLFDIFFTFLSISIIATSILCVAGNTSTNEYPILFDFTILMPNTSSPVYSYVFQLQDILPTIGIEISRIEATTYGDIYDRVWNYAGDLPIPIFAEGGYDTYAIGWNHKSFLNYDPSNYYSLENWYPAGENVYQFNDSELNLKCDEFNSTYTESTRVDLLHEIQQILYDTLPTIPIYFAQELVIHHGDLEGIDHFLWVNFGTSMEEWSFGDDSELSIGTFDSYEFSHPYDRNDNQYDDVTNQIYSSLLTKADIIHNYIPLLAKGYTFKNGGRDWFVEIDTNIKWADGQPFTTDDIVFSYQSLLEDEFSATQFGKMLSPIIESSSIIKINTTHVKFAFDKPYVFAEKIFTFPIIPKHIWQPTSDGGSGPEYSDWFTQFASWTETQPIKIFGVGPYKLNQYNSDTYTFHLIVNSYYNNIPNHDLPKIQNLYFKGYSNQETVLAALAADEIAIIDWEFSNSISDLDSLTNGVAAPVNVGAFYELGINHQHPILGTGELCPIAGKESAQHVRNAISYILDREELVSDIFTDTPGVAAATSIPINMYSFDETLEPHSFSKMTALNHLEQAGYDISPYAEGSKLVGESFIVYLSLFMLFFGLIFSLRKIKKE